MFLRNLKFKNIRSYQSLDLDFGGGKTLFSGDIGSGKSSILMGLEFALFGISSDVDGKMLLRKDCSFGSVELSFFCDGREVVVCRTLKRSGDSVQQGSGFLVVDGSRLDLTPTEIRSRVFELLNYPVLSSGQSKSFLFRFTVYTPQESMRKILFDSVDDRLSSIRFIFGVDKYKRVRENVKIVSSFLKERIAVFEDSSKDFDVKVKDRDAIDENIKKIESQISERSGVLKSVEVDLEKSKASLGVYEERLKVFTGAKNELSKLSGSLDEKKRLLSSFKEKLVVVDKRIADFKSVVFDSGDVGDFFSNLYFLKGFCNKSFGVEIESNEEVKSDFLSKISPIKVEIGVCNQKISSANSVIAKFNSDVSSECPLCFSVVDSSHREKVLSSQRKIVDDESGKLKVFGEEVRKLEEGVVSIEKKLSELRASDKSLSDFKQRLVLFEDFGDKLKDLNLDFSEKILSDVDVGVVLDRLEGLKVSFEGVFSSRVERESLESDRKKLVDDVLSFEKDVVSGEKEVSVVSKKLERFVDFEKVFSDEKVKYDGLLSRLSDVKVELSSLSAQLSGLRASLSLASVAVEKGRVALGSLGVFRSYLVWLQDWFVNVSHSIERQVLLSVFFELNDSFKFWFGEIIGFEGYDAFLNEDFSVSVLVDGYDVDVKGLSGGEKTACALAYRLAIGDVLSKLNSFVNTEDLLILDEPTDGFSYEQVSSMVEALNKSSFSQIILVSHEKNLESFVDSVVSVRKESGVSVVA